MKRCGKKNLEGSKEKENDTREGQKINKKYIRTQKEILNRTKTVTDMSYNHNPIKNANSVLTSAQICKSKI